MVGLGAACLVMALIAAASAAVLALIGTRGDRRYVDASRRAIYAFCALLTICVVVLEAAFLRSDFSVELVADHSSTTTPTFYKLTALWSSQGGSLLLWAWVLSIASSAVLFLTRRKHREIVPWATAILAGLGLFFCALMLFGANPFARLDPVPAEGAGLNPLLRHPMMAIHPVALYSGYVAFSIPFAFAIGALITRRLDASWIRSTRRFALVAWMLLGLGLLLGANWSYAELGWGGYWGWDPVENAALMPWLAGTAFLHSIMVQERRGMLKVWNVSLIVGTFALALLGTFLVRSGVLESIHAFGASTVGGPLLGLIAVVLIGSTALIISRLGDLRSERRIDSMLSREAVFLVNNLLLVGLVAVIFWGTFFPLIAEAVTGETSSLAAPWFNRYATPLAIGLVLFTGIGPLLAWRRLSASAAIRTFAAPTAVAVVATIALAHLHRLPLRARGPDPLLLRRLRARRARPGVRARRLGAAVARRRLLAGGAGRDRRPQPPPLRRLHRPRRDRLPADRGRRLVLVPDHARRQPAPRRHRDRRRLRGHLRPPDPVGRPGRAEAHLRLGDRGPPRRRAVRDADAVAQLLLRALRRLGGAACGASSRARRRARSVAAPGSAATSGPRCSPTSPSSTQ